MITKEICLKSLNKYLKDPHFGKEMYINALKYFIQELEIIIKKPTKKAIEDLRLFEYYFEGTKEQDFQHNLDGPITELFLNLNEDKINKKELNALLKKAKFLLNEYNLR